MLHEWKTFLYLLPFIFSMKSIIFIHTSLFYKSRKIFKKFQTDENVLVLLTNLKDFVTPVISIPTLPIFLKLSIISTSSSFIEILLLDSSSSELFSISSKLFLSVSHLLTTFYFLSITAILLLFLYFDHLAFASNYYLFLVKALHIFRNCFGWFIAQKMHYTLSFLIYLLSNSLKSLFVSKPIIKPYEPLIYFDVI